MKRPLLTCALLLCGVADAPADPSTTHRLFAGGDTMLARQLPARVLEHGPAWPLSPLADLIRGADVALVNLECVISARGAFWDKGERNPYYYRAPPWMIEVLTAGGIDVVMTANNHAMDFGPEALLDQQRLLDAVNIAAAGSGGNLDEAAQPRYVKVGDIVLAVIGLTTYNREVAARADRAGVLWGDDPSRILDLLGPAVAAARRHADLVIFSPHWGGNWTERPTPQRIELAHALIDLGVDAILGHSAHQVHGIEIYKGRPIVYDMGNLLWDTPLPRRGQWSAGYLLEFDRNGFTRLDVYPLELQAGRTVPAEGAAFDRIREMILALSTGLDPDIAFRAAPGSLGVDLRPEPRPRSERTPPARIYAAGGDVRMPDTLRTLRGNVVHASAPAWARAAPPVALAHGVEFLGARVPEVVRSGSGFSAEVALRVSGALEPGWQGMIRGVRRHADGEFFWAHPVADGNWLPEDWRSGETGIDLTLVRPPHLAGGTYDLSWRLERVDGAGVIGPAAGGPSDGFIPIGEIWVGSLGVPRGVSGVSWSGQPDARVRLLRAFNLTREVIVAAAWTGGALLAAALLALSAVLWRRHLAKT
ncbi:MAG: CapA family protein [Gammaproteobacteria bacterium]